MELFSIRIQRTFQLVSTPIPEISSFLDTDGRDIMQEKIKENYRRIKQDALDIIEAEMKRIEKDEKLAEKLLEKSE